MKPVMVFDGQYMLWRYLHIGNKIGDLDTDNICSRYLSSVLKLSTKFGSAEVVVLWDDGTPEWRKNLLPDYKSSRSMSDIEEPLLKAFLECKSKLKSVISNLGLVSFGKYGYEADDIAYFLSRRYPKTILVSDDKDWFLSVNDNTVVYRPIKEELVDLNWMADFMEEKEKPVEQYLWYKAILGDGSDDIEGITGIGPVSALKYSRMLVHGIDIDDSQRGLIIKNSLEKIIKNRLIMNLSWVSNDENLYQEYSTVVENRATIPKNEIEFILRLNGIKNQARNWERWKELFNNLFELKRLIYERF